MSNGYDEDGCLSRSSKGCQDDIVHDADEWSCVRAQVCGGDRNQGNSRSGCSVGIVFVDDDTEDCESHNLQNQLAGY